MEALYTGIPVCVAFMCASVHVWQVTSVSESVTTWTVAHQSLLSMGFSRQEYWSGLLCPPSGDLPNPGIEPTSLSLLHWLAGSLPLAPPGKTKEPRCPTKQPGLRLDKRIPRGSRKLWLTVQLQSSLFYQLIIVKSLVLDHSP